MHFILPMIDLHSLISTYTALYVVQHSYNSIRRIKGGYQLSNPNQPWFCDSTLWWNGPSTGLQNPTKCKINGVQGSWCIRRTIAVGILKVWSTVKWTSANQPSGEIVRLLSTAGCSLTSLTKNELSLWHRSLSILMYIIYKGFRRHKSTGGKELKRVSLAQSQ